MDLGFRAIGADTIGLYWPVFAAFAIFEMWLVRRVRRSGRFRAAWIASISVVAALLVAVLWVESFLAAQLVYQTVGEGATFDVWNEFEGHFMRTWPLLAPLGVVLLTLLTHPRSDAVMGSLVAALGVLASWIVAMWLFTTNHQPGLFQALVSLSGLGVLASLVGFGSATALWMAINRWWWREGRRRRHRGITSQADGNLPELRR